MTFYQNCLFFLEVVTQEKKAKFSFWARKVQSEVIKSDFLKTNIELF